MERTSNARFPAVELHDVSKAYAVAGRAVRALEPLSLSLERGEIVALTGPNGAGKSTTLRIVATLVEPTGGRALVCGHDVVLAPAAVRRSIGVSLGSERSFYWRISARHNLEFFARLEGVSRARVRATVGRVAAELGLERLLAVPARRLSRGSLARLSVARALVGDPAVLVLDEPFASVDVRGRRRIWRALERRCARGAAVLLATHESWIASHCDRAVALGATD